MLTGILVSLSSFFIRSSSSGQLLQLFLVTQVLIASASTSPLSDSFDIPSPSNHAPQGWTYSGPPEGQATVWTTETPFEGSHALRLSGLLGTQSWISTPFPVTHNRHYLLEWKARYRGEKIWRFRADFAGVEVEFLDSQGVAMSTVSQHSSCWQTPGWRPGWFLFEVPANTTDLRIRYALRTAEPLPGGFDIDSMVLRPYPDEVTRAEGTQRLILRTLDEYGKPAGTRIEFRDADGKTIDPPRGCISYGLNGGGFHPPMEGLVEADLKPGHYRIKISRGFEYEPVTLPLEITNDQDDPIRMEVSLKRIANWPERGCYCGDHHTHLYRHGGSLFTSLTWRDVLRVARCEGLDFLPFMAADKYPDDLLDGPELSRPGFTAELTQEITDDFWGHVCPLFVTPAARNDPRFLNGPMNLDRDAAISGEGGFLCYGHPYGPLKEGHEFEALADLKSHLSAREFPIDLALGMRCGIDLLAMEGERNQLDLKLRDLYRLYNLGFRPTLAASTDFHVDQGRQSIGSVRTYVHAKSLAMREIARGYREGHTFVTNGPLLDLHVNEKRPGDSIATQGEVLTITCEAVSLSPLDRLEVIVNGKVWKMIAAHGKEEIAISCPLEATQSLWLAARVWGPESETLASSLEGRSLGAGQFAHTTPVFVETGGKPIRSGSKEEAEYFVHWCEAVKSAWQAHLKVTPTEEENDSLVLSRIDAARQVFLDLCQ